MSNGRSFIVAWAGVLGVAILVFFDNDGVLILQRVCYPVNTNSISKSSAFYSKKNKKMSWLARSIANSLRLDDDVDNEGADNINATDSKSPPPPIAEFDQHSQLSSPLSTTATTPRGVKEDLSEITKTLTRQFWGVASFLAPPPQPDASSPLAQISYERTSDQDDQSPDPELSNEDLIAGIRSDFAEIGGKFKFGISKLSNNIASSEITKIASSFLQLGSEREFADEELIGNVIGVSEEVVAFARDVAMHPETWLDFPVPNDEDFDEFDMSDAQQEHALAVERLAPRLAALRLELCPGHMSEGCFWKIYFVLVHPRLDKEDAVLLSSPQVMEARAMLSQELENRAMAEPQAGWSGFGNTRSSETADLLHEESLSVPSRPNYESLPLKTSVIEAVAPTVGLKESDNAAIASSIATELETEKHPVHSTETPTIVVEKKPIDQSKLQHASSSSSSRFLDEKFVDDDDDGGGDGDDWLKDEGTEVLGASGTAMPLGNDEDVSFSDLEDDDGDVPTSYKKATSGSDTSTKDSRDWVQLGRSSTDSVKDIDPASLKCAGSEHVSGHNTETKESNDWLDVDDIDAI